MIELEGLDELNSSLVDDKETNQDPVGDTNDQQDTDDTTNSEPTDASQELTDDQPSPSDPDQEGTSNTNDTDDDTNDENEPTDANAGDLSGIERYLSNFNIDGGMIDFRDGTRKHFDELEPDKQLEVLTKLHETSAQSVEEKYGLDENEIGLINYLRQQEKPLDEVIDELARGRAEAYISTQNVKDTQIEDMSEDEVYTSFLLKSNPEATAEQIDEDLKKAKEMSTYGKTVESLKNRMLKDHQEGLKAQEQKNKDLLMSEIENQRKQVVSKVSQLDNLDGLALNDGIKNDVLDLILNVDEDGDSLFMTDVFSDPEKLFKAAFWYKNGKDIMESREEFWKKEKSAAYKRGLADAKGKTSTQRKTFSSGDVDKNKTTPHYDEPSDVVSFDDIHTI